MDSLKGLATCKGCAETGTPEQPEFTTLAGSERATEGSAVDWQSKPAAHPIQDHPAISHHLPTEVPALAGVQWLLALSQ